MSAADKQLDLSKLVINPDFIKLISDQVSETQSTERKRRRPLSSGEPTDTICDDEFSQEVRKIANEAVTNAVVSFEEKINQVLTAVNNTNTHIQTLDQKLITNTNKLENLSHEINTLRQDNKQELTEIKKDIKAHSEDLQQAKTQISSLANEIKSLQNDKLDMKRTLIDLSARSRRNNLIFFGIQKDGEKKSEELILDFIKNKLKIDEIQSTDIQRAHPLKKDVAGKPAPLIAYFKDFKMKEKVREKRFDVDKPFGIAQDLPPEIRAARKALSPKVEAAKRNGKKAWIIYPCKLVVDNVVTESLDVAKFCSD